MVSFEKCFVLSGLLTTFGILLKFSLLIFTPSSSRDVSPRPLAKKSESVEEELDSKSRDPFSMLQMPREQPVDEVDDWSE